MGEIAFSLLDVGQGLAAVVQTRTHILVYDAGPRTLNWDSGRNIVVPYLQSRGIVHLDKLVISHPDNDHIGGARAILAHFPVATIATSVPAALATPVTQLCLSGTTWQWDGVTFRFLYPSLYALQGARKNDRSCVLRIDNGDHAILLTGDIERYAEEQLWRDPAVILSADIMVVPHHGSKTSAWQPFVAKVRPKFVLYALGYRNRYHFPHQSVVALYHLLGAKQFTTAAHGMIFWQIDHRALHQPVLYRQQAARYWWQR